MNCVLLRLYLAITFYLRCAAELQLSIQESKFKLYQKVLRLVLTCGPQFWTRRMRNEIGVLKR